MATIALSSLPGEITELQVTPVENILDITTVFQSATQLREYTIEVITGSFKFCVGKAISAENPLYAAGDKVILTMSEEHKLRFLATAQNNVFNIAY